MLENNSNNGSQRNQLIAIVLMTVLVVAWSFFFLPKPSETPPPEETPVSDENTGTPDSAAVTDPAPPPPDQPVQPVSPPLSTEQAGTPEEQPEAMAALPASATEADPGADEITLSRGAMDVVFTRVGARIKRVLVYLDEEGRDTRQLVPDWGDVPDVKAVYPMGLRFSDDFLGDELDRRCWDVVGGTEADTAAFSITVPGVARIEKRFTLTGTDYVLKTAVTWTNLSGGSQVVGKLGVSPAYSLNWGPNVNSGDAHKFMKQTIVWLHEGAMEQEPTSGLKMAPGRQWALRMENPAWAAIRSCYFVIAMKPEYENAEGWVAGFPEHFRMGLTVPRIELAADESFTREFSVYMGPRLDSALEAAWPDLDKLMEIFTVWGFTPMATFMNKFSLLMLGIMNWFYNHIIGNYGIAIIFVTLIVRLGMFPLTFKSMKSMKKMQMLAPEIEKIKEEIGEDNQQELQQRMMELYRERGVSPLGGCFPMLLQMPVFIAFYRMLSNAYELRHAPFLLWIHDLSEPDALFQLPVAIPMPFGSSVIDSFNLLPILMGVAMLLSQKLMPTSGPVQNQQQKLMMTIMPVFFSFICYNMASSLNLYILTSTVLGILQNYAIRTSDIDVSPKPKKKKTARSRHFYTAAQARKREMAKETRREKKSKQQSRPKKNDPSGKSGKKRP